MLDWYDDMLNENITANKILARNVDERYRDTYLKYKNIDQQAGVSDLSSIKKVIRILCMLELIDKWDDVERITGSTESAPARTAQYDPYGCVPVPNTMYYLQPAITQGSCMISTIRNLLCILCQDTNPGLSLRNEVRNYIITLNNAANKRDFVSGTTNPEDLKRFADIVHPFKPVSRYCSVPYCRD